MERINVFVHDELGKEITTLCLCSAPELNEILKIDGNFYKITTKVRITHPKCSVEDFAVKTIKLSKNPITNTN